jgi:hypothetical protein
MRILVPPLLLVALAAWGCGTSAEPAEPPPARDAVELVLTVRETPGGLARRATLRCAGARARATGYLAGRAGPACRAARRLAGLLAAPPARHRVCTQVYGGPERARVRGTVEGRAVDRRFGRADGCEIADYERAAPLLRVAP